MVPVCIYQYWRTYISIHACTHVRAHTKRHAWVHMHTHTHTHTRTELAFLYYACSTAVSYTLLHVIKSWIYCHIQSCPSSHNCADIVIVTQWSCSDHHNVTVCHYMVNIYHHINMVHDYHHMPVGSLYNCIITYGIISGHQNLHTSWPVHNNYAYLHIVCN